MTAAWVCLASAVWLLGGAGRGRRGLASARTRPELSARTLGTMAVIAEAVLAIAVLGTQPGLIVAAVLAPVLAVGVRHAHASRSRRTDVRDLPFALDLTATALRCGQPVAAAVQLGAGAALGSVRTDLAHAAGLLRLGADPVDAWRALARDAVLAPVARAACRSAQSGIRLADGFEQLASDLRAEAQAAAQARAHRAGVLAMAPLGLCFLPGFICLGVVPVIAGVARDVFTGLGS